PRLTPWAMILARLRRFWFSVPKVSAELTLLRLRRFWFSVPKVSAELTPLRSALVAQRANSKR
ncbi:MAG TPA: hypothetical protein VFG11_10575, partial [Acidobacteriota bacterium]|nr:hypothetical protein [Acidobacteriota bacterium]